MHPMTRSLDPNKEGENKATSIECSHCKEKARCKNINKNRTEKSICCPTVQMITMWDKPIPNQENCLCLSIEKKMIIYIVSLKSIKYKV